MKNFVFVYGTLRKNLHNPRFLGSSELVGTFLTKKKYRMCYDELRLPYLVKAFRVPEDLHSLIAMRTKYRPCVGEVYKVSEKTLDLLDSLEKHPTWYKRELISIKGFKEKCWCYLYADPEEVEILPQARQTDDRCYDWALNTRRKIT
jgi:gamma-glutamylcyclotransferase (GGCT)/AIG2-like uncharacterized protein YtfP